MRMTFYRLMVAGAVSAAFYGSFAAAADRETLTVGRVNPTPQQVEKFLFPEAECENTQYQCLAVRPSTERSIGMDVKFQTGSADLTPEARAQLEGLGKALASRNGKLNPGEIVIEGHTDARGAADLNKKLSEKRAESVAKHLVAVYGVDAKALRPVGRGKEDLKDAARPESETNRRVELVRRPN
jgi:outer membrane protein OmpA-like peptidoglycan-associated protein